MAIIPTTSRPFYVGPDWLRCTEGMSFAAPPPEQLRHDDALCSANPWERLVCVTLQAQAGDFRHVALLLELAQHEPDDHLRDCAIAVLGLAAPSDVAAELPRLFQHRDQDTRLSAYRAIAHTCCPSLADALVRQRVRVKGFERARVMDQLSDMLEVDSEELELVDSPLDDEAFAARVDALLAAIAKQHGRDVAIFLGEPLDASKLVASIAALCAEDEPEYHGGTIEGLFARLEGLTGWPYAGCLDSDCTPVLPKISHTLNSLRQSGRVEHLEPGRRYFFGYPLA